MKRIVNKRGFTLIEIIAVLMVIGIIAAIVISRASSTTVYTLDAEVQIVKSHLRYAQVRALSDDTTWGIAFSGNAYTLQKDGANTTVDLPNEGSATHRMPAGMSVSPAVTVTFDHLGSPGTATITLTLSHSGQSGSIVITRNTGFIP